jgi:hypothetical protein
MHRLLSILTICVALLALVSPSVATGLCVAHGGLPVVSASADGNPVHLPSPCEMQGGKRILPAQPDFCRSAIEVPRATCAQWARGLADQLLRDGLAHTAELPPPRLG